MGRRTIMCKLSSQGVANQVAANEWFKENDPESVAFGYDDN
jgi:hypothetical protein